MGQVENIDTQAIVDDFWQQSLAFYDASEVSEYLLYMQDSQQKNVNEMLFALWLGQYCEQAIEVEQAERLKRRAKRTKKWVANIRKTRKELEAQWQPPYPEKIESARNAMLDSELQMEKLHQQKLVESAVYLGLISELTEPARPTEDLLFDNLTTLCEPANSEMDYVQLIELWFNYWDG